MNSLGEDSHLKENLNSESEFRGTETGLFLQKHLQAKHLGFRGATPGARRRNAGISADFHYLCLHSAGTIQDW